MQREPNRRVAALKAVRQMMKTRFMKVFALFRLKKHKEPLYMNELRPDEGIDFYDGTDMQDFDDDMKDIMAMKAKKIAIAQKSEAL
jgi:hypothetical protein